MSDVGGDSGVDAGAIGGEPLGFDSPALTTTDDLRAGIAQTYGLGPTGAFSPSLYMSRTGQFYSSFQAAPPPKTRERRHPFVLNTYLKQDLGVKVYQPTGYAVPRDLQAADTLQESQFKQRDPMADPIDSAFGDGKPMLDRKLKDTVRPEDEGRLVKETDLRRRAIHVSKGRKDQYDYEQR